MTRDQYESTFNGLPLTTNAYVSLGTPEVVHETPKAILMGFNAKQLWFPKSQLAVNRDRVFGTEVFVRRSWVARERLWRLVNDKVYAC